MQNIRILQLDGLRGVFSLMVVVYHFPYENKFSQVIATSNFIIRQGDLFVDFFFVLSGFVISLNYIDSLKSPGLFINYLKARFIRLYPLLLYTSLVFFAFQLSFNIFMPHLLDYPQPFSRLLLRMVNTLLFLNSTPVFGVAGINFPSWSISSEMISCIVFGLAMLLAGKTGKYVLALVAVLAGVFLMYTGTYMQTFTWGFARGLVCFITGVFAFMAFRKYGYKVVAKYWEYIIPVLLILLLYSRYHYIKETELFTLLTIPAFFGIAVYVYALSSGLIVKMLSGGVLQYLSKISYSMYLNHAIVMIVISKTAFNVIKLPVNDLTVTVAILVYLACVIAYSRITYTWVEKKGAKLLKQHTFFGKKQDSIT